MSCPFPAHSFENITNNTFRIHPFSLLLKSVWQLLKFDNSRFSFLLFPQLLTFSLHTWWLCHLFNSLLVYPPSLSFDLFAHRWRFGSRITGTSVRGNRKKSRWAKIITRQGHQLHLHPQPITITLVRLSVPTSTLPLAPHPATVPQTIIAVVPITLVPAPDPLLQLLLPSLQPTITITWDITFIVIITTWAIITTI